MKRFTILKITFFALVVRKWWLVIDLRDSAGLAMAWRQAGAGGSLLRVLSFGLGVDCEDLFVNAQRYPSHAAIA